MILACIIFLWMGITNVAANFFNNDWEFYDLEPNIPCTSDKCLDAAQEIVNGIDTSVNPCDNFYYFACNGWLQRNLIPPYMPRWSVFTKLQLKMHELSIGILSQPKTSSEPKPVQMAKDHYEACMESRIYDDIRKQNESLQFIWDKLEQYGGWPILYKNGTWNSSRFNWMDSVVGLKREFDYTQLIDVTIYQSRDGNVSANSIVLRPPSFGSSSVENVPNDPDSGLESQNNDSNYKTFIMNITKELLTFKGREINETYISAVADQIILTELLFKHLEKGSIGAEEYTVETLQTYLDAHSSYKLDDKAISGEDLLHKFFDSPVNIWIWESQLVTVMGADYLSRLSDFIMWLKTEAFANYLHFKMLVKLISLSNAKTLHEYMDTLSMHNQGTSMPWPNDQRCAEKVEESFQMPLGFALLEKIGLSKYDSQSDSYGSANNFTTLKKMYYNIKAAYEKLLVESSPDYMNLDFLQYELGITNLCAGYPYWIFSRERLDSEYDGLKWTCDNLGKSLDYMQQSIALNSMKFVQQLKNIKKARDTDPCQWPRYLGTVGAFSRAFSVYLPVAMLQEPFYDEDLPKFLNFGKIGTILGHEMTHGLYGLGWSESIDGNLTSPATCLANQYQRFYNSIVNSSLNGNLTLEENFCDNAGLAVAFSAYRRSSLSDGPHNLKGLEKYTNDQLFFLGFAQTFCETSTPAGLSSLLESDPHSPGPVRILAALRNSKEFAQTWHCPTGSNMNPGFRSDETCAIFDSSDNSIGRSVS